MRTAWRAGAATLAALVLASAATAAGDEEILAHYEAYEAALQAGDFAKADAEGEAAWKAAEEGWGAIEDTAVLAFNLARLRLMNDERAKAVEPAQRISELVESGAAGASVTPAEADLFLTLARFDATNVDQRAVKSLEEALEDYEPTDAATTRIALRGWHYAASGYAAVENWRGSYRAAREADLLVAKDSAAPIGLKVAVALVAVRAAYEDNHVPQGIAFAQRGAAAFPPQPPGQPIDPTLASLILWQAALINTQMFGPPGAAPAAPPTDPALMNPAWDDLRYPSPLECPTTWKDADPPKFDPDAPVPAGMGALLEYSLAADGSVVEVKQISPVDGPEAPFAATLRTWKAEPPASEKCRGPLLWPAANFLPPPGQERSLR